jgi:hypothetical protein
MRYLKDSEIIDWSKKLEGSNLLFSPNTNMLGSTSIRISRVTESYVERLIKDIPDCEISYKLSFSVTENRKNDFFNLLNRVIKNGFKTTLIYDNKISEIKINHDIVLSKEETIHSLYNRNFIRYSYNFKGLVSEIIAYSTMIEDTINYFSLIWGYDEEGNEHCLLKYPIGSIVSMNNDKSRDYLVVDYNYSMFNNKEYRIGYVISEILTDPKSAILRYGVNKIEHDNTLCFSRNDRIDNILN